MEGVKLTHHDSADRPSLLGPVPSALRQRLVAWLLLVAVALTGFGIFAQIAWELMPGRPNLRRVLGPLLLGNEANVPTWYSGSLMLLAAGCALAVGLTERRGSGAHERAWFSLAIVLVVMSADEVGRVHETLNLVGAQVVEHWGWEDVGVLRYPWVVPGALIAVLVGALFLPLLRDVPRPDRTRLGVAGVVFLAGALGLEMASAAMDRSTPLLVRIGAQNLEEFLEMVGMILLIRALLFIQSASHAITQPVPGLR